MRKILMTTALTLGTALGATVASAQEIIEVEMLNRNDAGDRMVFSQELIRADVGDTIRFIPTQKGHNAQSVRDAVPEGQESFRGRINEEIDYVVTETGLTAVVCLPHQALGMVALIMVGDDAGNAEQILEARIPGKGGDKIEALVADARALQPVAPPADDDASS